MKSTEFLNDFRYVELDQDVDLIKFKKVEKEWKRVNTALNLKLFLISQPELRFKKLGKHRALGLYYPSLQCVCIDINSPSSFIHEVGHHIDYTNDCGQLSLQAEFFPLASEYKKLYNSYVRSNSETVIGKFLRRKMDYYFTPTEIFARTLEIYLAYKDINTSLLKDKERLQIDAGYPEVSEYFLKIINEYYDNLLTLNLEELEKEEVSEPKISNYMIEEIKYSDLEQIGFSL